MTQIQHVNPDSTTMSHDGKTYESSGAGVFDVPPDAAKALVRFKAQYRMFDGKPWPEPEPRTEQERQARATRSVVHEALAEAMLNAPIAKRSRKK